MGTGLADNPLKGPWEKSWHQVKSGSATVSPWTGHLSVRIC